MGTTTYVIRTFGGVFPITLNTTPNATFIVRSGASGLAVRSGSVGTSVRSGSAAIEVRGA